VKIMIDTNIFISAILFPDGCVAEALEKALKPPFEPLICDYVLDELRCKFQEKFPSKMTELDTFLSVTLKTITMVQTPKEETDAKRKIRDEKDRPILRAALNAGADLFLTGDKDFLESSVTVPKMVNAKDFLTLY